MPESRSTGWIEDVKAGKAPMAKMVLDAILKLLADGEMHEKTDIAAMIRDKHLRCSGSTLKKILDGLVLTEDVYVRIMKDPEDERLAVARWYWLK